MFGFRYCKYLTRVKTRIHFTHKPQKDEGERKEKEKEDWQVKSIIFLEVHRGTEPYKTHSANLFHPFPASQYRLQDEHQSPTTSQVPGKMALLG